jgi:adenylate kinase
LERTGLPQISTGDMFRELAKADTPLAREVRGIQAAGQLVSDELVARVVRERTGRADCAGGYVLDGFPRTTAQADMLEQLAAEQGREIQAILIDTPFDVLEKRMTGRRNCPVCNEIYNVHFRPPKSDNVCDLHPGAQLNHRADDNAETVKSRLETYERQTRPLLDYYERSGRLRRVEGTRDVDAIYADVEKIVKGES